MAQLFNRLLALVLLPAICLSVSADPPVEEKWSVDLALTVSPQEAPMPAFRFRLFPLWSERKAGDAAPIYLRFAHERRDDIRKDLVEKPLKWNEMPVEMLPLKEVRQYVDSWKYNLKQLDLGARRKSCDWNYALDVDNVIGILLPDAQEMRMHGGLLVLKARLEIAEGKHDEAIRTLETSFAFGSHVAEGTFLINGLVAMGIANRTADCLPDLIQRPDAPNLYWALTALPRPLIDLRKELDFEHRLGEYVFPDLTDLDRPRSPDEWAAALNRVVKKLQEISDMMQLKFGLADSAPGPAPGDVAKTKSVAAMIARLRALPAAKKHLTDKLGVSAKKAAEMSAPQILLLHLAAEYREARDDAFKACYLPYPEAKAAANAAKKRRQDITPAWDGVLLMQAIVPAIERSLFVQARLDRKIAALRVVEALRLHAAANKGQLPDNLEQIKVVPIPLDPCTSKAFDFRRDGDSAIITSQVPGDNLALSGMRIRLTMRK